MMWQYTGDGKCNVRPRSAFPKGIANMRHAERNIFNGARGDVRDFWQSRAWSVGAARAATAEDL